MRPDSSLVRVRPTRSLVIGSMIGLLGVLAWPIAVGAASAGVVLSGRVTDASGVEPVSGAVVSLEVPLAHDGTAVSTPLPKFIAVWQVSTDADGRFEITQGARGLELPIGGTMSKARIKVFALAYATYQSREFALKTQSLGGRRVKVLPADGEATLHMVQMPQDLPSFSFQIDGWSAEIRQGLQGGIWPGGRKQTEESYQPLLGLLSTSCRMLNSMSRSPLAACEKATKEFAFAGATAPKATVIPAPSIPEPPAPVAPMKIEGGGPVPAGDAGMKPNPGG